MLNAKIVQIVRRIASEKLEEIEIEATVKVDYPAHGGNTLRSDGIQSGYRRGSL
jgi:hypothetical protein